MNLPSILILIAVFVAMIFAIRCYRKGGSCSCGCDGNCSGCSLQCEKNTKNKTE